MAQGYQNHFYHKQAQQKQQSLYNGKVLLEKYDPPVVYDSEKTLQLAQESGYVNGMKSRKKNQSANVSKSANQRKHKPRVWKPKKVGSKERFASPKPSTPRSCLRWSPTGRMFNLKGKIIATSEFECQPDCSKGCQNWLDTLLISLFSEYKPKDKENHRDNECDG
ncbi:hypothetical protein Tco_0565267 [Tanacetum coccineum]